MSRHDVAEMILAGGLLLVVVTGAAHAPRPHPIAKKVETVATVIPTTRLTTTSASVACTLGAVTCSELASADRAMRGSCGAGYVLEVDVKRSGEREVLARCTP